MQNRCFLLKYLGDKKKQDALKLLEKTNLRTISVACLTVCWYKYSQVWYGDKFIAEKCTLGNWFFFQLSNSSRQLTKQLPARNLSSRVWLYTGRPGRREFRMFPDKYAYTDYNTCGSLGSNSPICWASHFYTYISSTFISEQFLGAASSDFFLCNSIYPHAPTLWKFFSL